MKWPCVFYNLAIEKGFDGRNLANEESYFFMAPRNASSSLNAVLASLQIEAIEKGFVLVSVETGGREEPLLGLPLWDHSENAVQVEVLIPCLSECIIVVDPISKTISGTCFMFARMRYKQFHQNVPSELSVLGLSSLWS